MLATLGSENQSYKTEQIFCECGEKISKTDMAKHKKTESHKTSLNFKRILNYEPQEGDLFTKEMKAMLFLIANISHPEPRNKNETMEYKKAVVDVGNEIERLFVLRNATKATTTFSEFSLEYWVDQLVSPEFENTKEDEQTENAESV